MSNENIRLESKIQKLRTFIKNLKLDVIYVNEKIDLNDLCLIFPLIYNFSELISFPSSSSIDFSSPFSIL